MGLFGGRKTIYVDSDVLVIGGGMAGCGATYEARYWGRDLNIVCVEKANIDRSGAVAQGLYAINTYMGMQWDENQPEDHVRYARNDLMGLVREDLGYRATAIDVRLLDAHNIEVSTSCFRRCSFAPSDGRS